MSEATTPPASYRDGIGLNCRKCGHRHFYVVYTRAADGGRVIRRRACHKCGTRITTWERAVGG